MGEQGPGPPPLTEMGAGAQPRQERTTETTGRVEQLRSWEVGIPLELKQGMGPHLQMRWNTWGSSQVSAGNLAFISSCGGVLWAPLREPA